MLSDERDKVVATVKHFRKKCSPNQNLTPLEKAAETLLSSESDSSTYSQTSLIRTPKGQNKVSALLRCPYYRGRECMIFGISGNR